MSPLGVPCQKPPFGTLSAVDMNTQQLAWSVPAGTVQDAYVTGVRVRLPLPIGMPTIGGSMVTQGVLLFFCGHPGLRPARLRQRDRQRVVERAPAGRHPRDTDQLRLAANRRTVHSGVCRRWSLLPGLGVTTSAPSN